jgi:3-oxoacyl-[acyl-carrier-protein] synthase-3
MATPAVALVETAVDPADESLSLEKIAPVIGLTDAEVRRYRRFFGLDSVRWSPGRGVADLLLGAARSLASLPGDTERVRYVIHARSLEPAAPYGASPLTAVVRALGLRRATAFAVSQHSCASGLLAVELAGRLLAADGDPDARALVLTGEKAYPHVSRFIPAVTVFGEAAAACLVALGPERDRLMSYTTTTLGEFHWMTEAGTDLAARFDQAYTRTLVDVLNRALAGAGVGRHRIRLILPHNVNRMTWARVCRRLGLPIERVWLENVPVTGHCFCADPFINLAQATRRGALRPGDHYLLVSVGLGATFSAMVFRH